MGWPAHVAVFIDERTCCQVQHLPIAKTKRRGLKLGYDISNCLYPATTCTHAIGAVELVTSR